MRSATRGGSGGTAGASGCSTASPLVAFLVLFLAALGSRDLHAMQSLDAGGGERTPSSYFLLGVSGAAYVGPNGLAMDAPLQVPNLHVTNSLVVSSVDLLATVRDLAALVANLTQRLADANDRVANLTTRVQAAEQLNGAATPLSTTITGLGSAISGLESSTTNMQSAAFANVSSLRTSVDVLTANFLSIQPPAMTRVIFSSSDTWAVPPGTTSALVTIAGGGGSGLGWRIMNMFVTGPSGGFLLSQPMDLVPGEILTITVGAGGVGGVPVVGGKILEPPYYDYYVPPANSDGLTGKPGSSSVITSATRGELLRCAGGSGAYAGGIDAYSDATLAPGGLLGAILGSGNPQLNLTLGPRTYADGLYSNPTGPGACGPNSSGLGRAGSVNFIPGSGIWEGGNTPIGWGSGGGISRMGCYVTPTDPGLCVSALDARGGIVILDYLT